MDSFFGGLKSFVKGKKTEIDNYVFRMHYRLTLIILVAFSLLVTARQYIGDPIDCISRDDIPHDLLDTYCWIHPTFSVVSAWHKEVGHEVPYPGVERYTKGEKTVQHAYYQWVCFVLFLQAVLFYIPRYFWKAMEANKMNNLILELNSPVCPQKTKGPNIELLVEYLTLNRNNHRFYYFCYCLAELMNVVNVIGQMLLMDRFLDGEFSWYGHWVIQFTEWHWSARYDPMIKVFPRLAKCTFYKYGSSGSVQRHDAMCILPLNIVNEKIYVFLWFWFVILSVISCLALIYRIAVTFVPRLRVLIFNAQNRLVKRKLGENVVKQLSVGDWHLLYLLSKNIEERNFNEVMEGYSINLEEIAKTRSKNLEDVAKTRSKNLEDVAKIESYA